MNKEIYHYLLVPEGETPDKEKHYHHLTNFPLPEYVVVMLRDNPEQGVAVPIFIKGQFTKRSYRHTPVLKPEDCELCRAGVKITGNRKCKFR